MKRLLLFLCAFTSFEAFALDVEYFKFSNSKTYAQTDDALLDNSVVSNDYPWILTAAYDYVKIPLSVQVEDDRVEEIVKSLHGLHLGGGFRPWKNLLIGARTYMAQIETDQKGIYLGDTILEAKWRFYQSKSTAIALAPRVTVPTGTNEFSTDNNKFSEYLGLNIERRFKYFQLSAIVGYVNRPGATYSLNSSYSSLDYKQAIYTAIGSIFPLSEKWALNIEAYRYNQLKGDQYPNEGYLGVRHQTSPSLQSFAGLSIGGMVDKTSNDYRISAGLKYTPAPPKKSQAPLKRVAEKPRPIPAPIPEPEVAPVVDREAGLIEEKEAYGALIGSETIYFANASSYVDVSSQTLVKRFFEMAGKLGTEYTVVLEGFASKVGNPVSNLKLSENRILKSREFLNSLGANDKSIKEVAYGDSTAKSSNPILDRKVILRLYKSN